MPRSAQLRAYSALWEAAQDPNAPLPILRLSGSPGQFSVASFRRKRSGRSAARRYLVRLAPSAPPFCACPWFSDPRNESGSCKHIEIVRHALYIRRGLGDPLPSDAQPSCSQPLGGGGPS